MQNTEQARQRLKTRIKSGVTYGQLAAELKVSKGALWRFINDGYIPKSNVIRSRLGLPEIIEVFVQRDDRGRFSKAGR